MQYDYGYMEEGRLGRPYNLKLLKRLGQYALPYKKITLISLSLALVITLIDIAVPYLSKIAIDRYILSSWHMVDLSVMEQKQSQRDILKYDHLLKDGKGPFLKFISHIDLKKIDPAELRKYYDEGILSDQQLYRIMPEYNSGLFSSGSAVKDILKMADGSILVPMEILGTFSKAEILKIRSKDLKGLVLISIVLMGLILFSFGFSYLEYYLLEYIGQKIMQDIRLGLFSRIQSRALSFFDRNPVGRLVTRVTNDVENLNEMFKSVLVTVFKDFFILAGILVVLLYLNWRLAIVSFIILPFIAGFTIVFSSLMREVFREMREKVAKLNSFMQERFSGMRIIQLFAVEGYQMNRFAMLNHENFLAGMKQIRLFAVFVPVMELISSLAVALILWHGGNKVIVDQLSLGSLVAFISYIQMFFKPIRDISEKYNIMQLAMASTERIFEFIDNGEEISDPILPKTKVNYRGHLEFRDVSFSYDKKNAVLKDISFEVKPGEMVAVVGATGAGKSTLVSLIERFYDPDKGAVLLDGTDIRDISKSDLRSKIGLVMQDVFLFSGTIKDNIDLVDGRIETEMLNRAIKNANASEVISGKPKGLYQEIGEGGSTLSGGERQLLSFARALACDPKILILDEATSSVDPENEKLIQDAISIMTKERTTLVVAHRLSTIRKADRIIVMHHGSIREQGTHDELMEAGGIYYRLNKFREYSLIGEG